MGANCVASTSIGCLFFGKGCSAEKVRNTFTFIPPPPSYSVEAAPGEEGKRGKLTYLMDVLRRNPLYRQAAEVSEVLWVKTKRGMHVPLVWVGKWRRQSAGEEEAADQPMPPLVLLHCHGNATDIGLMMVPYYELAKVLGVDVVGVEYSGYGAASGKPSCSNTCSDVEAAYDYVISCGIPANRIVAYGQSIGSGPVMSLASKRQLGGVVLHSPLLSGIKVVDPRPDHCCRPSCVWHCFDFYPNDRWMKKLTCPVFLMHGQRDEIIPFYHGRRLHRACPKGFRWPAYFPELAGHNDIVETDIRRYFGEISHFLQDLKRIADEQIVEASSDEFEQEVKKGLRLGQPQVVDEHRPLGDGMEDAEQSGGTLPRDARDFLDAPQRPIAGPEDGRYEELRKGNYAVPGGPCPQKSEVAFTH